MNKGKKLFSALVLLIFTTSIFAQIASFPGAEGFGSKATGGRNGRVIYVTNLNVSGAGSLQAALNETGKRYILFKVSGIIPGTMEVPIGNGDFTLAGQTSPSGIIVRGFQSYNGDQKSASNIIIRHLRSRIGDIKKYPSNYWIAEDGITLGGVQNAIIDHCSFGHASDEAVDISRSSKLTIQNCLLAETLGGHWELGGMLINYSSSGAILDSLSIHHNIWNRIGGRMPEISCETSYCNGKTINLELSENLIWDPKIELWYEGTTGQNGFFNLRMNAVNNYSYANSGFGNAMFHFDMLSLSANKLYFSGNQLNLYPQYKDYQLFYCCNDFNKYNPNTTNGIAQKATSRFDFPTITYQPIIELRSYMFKNAGAFPRDQMDNRLMSFVNTGTFDLKSQNEDHYGDTFLHPTSKNPPLDSDGDGIPDYWEKLKGLNPLIQDHNGTQLSSLITGVDGYTNLECYLNCLSDALVNGQSTSNCQINLDITSYVENQSSQIFNISYYPNPAQEILHITIPQPIVEKSQISILNSLGKILEKKWVENSSFNVDISAFESGIYFLKYTAEGKVILSRKVIVIK